MTTNDNTTNIVPTPNQPSVPAAADFISGAMLATPTQDQLNAWVKQALDAFIGRHADGLEFTAWMVAKAIIAVYGAKYFIPHRSQPNLIGIRELVHTMMQDGFDGAAPLMDSATAPYEAVMKAAPDGNGEANYYVPLLNPQINPTVTVSVPVVDAGDQSVTPALGDGNTVIVNGGFNFTD